MKKTKTDSKKLSMEVVTVRRLETELTPEQLKAANGAGGPPGLSNQGNC